MLTPAEKIAFVLLAVLSLGLATRAFLHMARSIQRGEGKLQLNDLIVRALRALWIYISQQTTLRRRPLVSLLHLGVVWGFTYYFLVNFGDVLEGFFGGFKFLGATGPLASAYRLVGDLLSVAVIVGVIFFLVRRFVLHDRALTYHDNVLLHPRVVKGEIRRDSLIVGLFILFHVGARFLGQSTQLALGVHEGAVVGVGPQPFAGAVAGLWGGLNADTLVFLDHLYWWVALGGILAFIPYFPYSKHAHLFMAPLNYLSKPERTSLGEMEKEDFDDESKEQFGAAKLEHLPKTHLFDAFACIMCNRCQDACPAYVTGKELSPSAWVINKRFLIKERMADFAAGKDSEVPLVGSAISESAVWACTACGACIDVCPVGNEPMLDILDLRRDRVLVQADFPADLRNAFNGMERQGNPWQISESRMKWADGLDVPTVEEKADFDILYWVGCAASFEPRAQQVARSFVGLMRTAGVNFAVLGEQEMCTGDTARRAGREDLYMAMAEANVELLNSIQPKRIVTTCPHCLHNLGKEYHQFGGNYTVIHHTELIAELMAQGRLPASAAPVPQSNVTFHDPCYLGRHNGILDAPRDALSKGLGVEITEMPRSGRNSFCCGAGGAQFWKEEEHGAARVNHTRYAEAKATGAATLAVGCPFCLKMFTDAGGDVAGGPAVKDVAELIAERLAGGESGAQA